VAEDVAATYDRFVNLPARFKQSLAMVDRVETPDDRTVVFKLNMPYPHFLTTMASPSYLWILSREAATGEIDPATVWIGTGPFIREKFEPSKETFSAKHPEYFLSPLPYVDGIRTAIVPEAAQRVSQFIAGNTDTQFISSLDLESILRSVPDVQLIGDDGNVGNLLNFFYFSGIDPESPFKDERVRRAASMAIDRDALIEVVYNISVNERLGIQRETRWHNIVPAGLSKWWLDPKGDEIGDAGRWYEFNPAESKKLLSAAGYDDGLPTELHFTAGIYAFTGYDTAAEAIIPMLNEAGFNVQPKVEDYLAEYITKTFLGEFKDMAFGLETIFTEVDEYLFNMLHPDGIRNHGKIDDPELTSMIEDQRLEPDPERRKEIIYDIQRYVSDKMYYVPLIIGGSSQFVVAHPWVGNFGKYNTASFGITTESTMHLFLRR
jgi:ABC-type transport system substrate-binding protein